jgi:hypothetical protein
MCCRGWAARPSALTPHTRNIDPVSKHVLAHAVVVACNTLTQPELRAR